MTVYLQNDMGLTTYAYLYVRCIMSAWEANVDIWSGILPLIPSISLPRLNKLSLARLSKAWMSNHVPWDIITYPYSNLILRPDMETLAMLQAFVGIIPSAVRVLSSQRAIIVKPWYLFVAVSFNKRLNKQSIWRWLRTKGRSCSVNDIHQEMTLFTQEADFALQRFALPMLLGSKRTLYVVHPFSYVLARHVRKRNCGNLNQK